jgi:hypothetical protein
MPAGIRPTKKEREFMKSTFFDVIICTMLALAQAPAFAGDLMFGYKGATLGSSEKSFKKKNKEASCFTNPLDKTRECIIRDTTYLNDDVDEMHAIFARDRLGQVKITFKESGMRYDPKVSPEVTGIVRSLPYVMCDSKAHQLEERFGPFHKEFERRLTPGTDVLKTRVWYGANGELTYENRSNLFDENGNFICENEITMVMKNFYELKEKAKFGKRAIDDM